MKPQTSPMSPMPVLRMPLLALGTALLLGGCSLLAPWSAPRQDAAVATQAPSELDLSRAAFSRGNYGIAIKHLELALARSPASVAALNGLGASYDGLGRHDVALRYYFRALALAPESPLTLNNIGYSYYLQGRRTEALQYLALALAQDAGHAAARENQRLALALPAPQTAEAIASTQAAAQAANADTDAAPAAAVAIAAATSPQPLAAAELPAPQRATLPLPASVRIEVSNGNGVTGMGARVRASLQQEGGNVVRLTNADNYAYAVSTVYYRAGFGDHAAALAVNLPGTTVAVQQSDVLVDWVDLKLLIGRDMVAAGDFGTTAATLASHDLR